MIVSPLTQHTHIPPIIQQGIPLADKSWFGTGGRAQWYAEPTTCVELQDIITWARHTETPLTCLGAGANILISDAGIQGLVIRPSCTDIAVSYEGEHAYVTAGSGVVFDRLITWCLEKNLLGLEEFSGIPGRVGGCVYMNIHYFHALLDQYIIRATVLNKLSGLIEVVDRAWFNFGYDYSRLHEGTHILIDATFALRCGSELDGAHARGRYSEIVRHRAQRYPQIGTCGSFFRNFFEHEVTLISNGKRMIFVAYYLDKLGVKGSLSVGKACVSYQHANMIVAHPGATSADVIAVARTMQELVYAQFGIMPQPECQFLGFEQYPLHT